MSVAFFNILPKKSIDNRFIMVVKSDNAGESANNQFTIRTFQGLFLYDIKTSDGYTATGITGNHTITFPSGVGTHEVYITGAFPLLGFQGTGDKNKVLQVLNWGDYGLQTNGLRNTNYGESFFRFNNLNFIASGGAWFNAITSGDLMFLDCNLTSLPDDMLLPNLVNGIGMFPLNSISSLPPLMELNNLQNGQSMFLSNSLTDLPSGMTLPSLTNGTTMLNNNTINTTRYSQLLVDLESGNPNNSVPFHGGNSKFNPTGQTARNILTAAPRNWTITDGGLE